MCEDFFGDMDFKVAGTHKGITAIQMDLKISGLTPEIIKEALHKTHVARDYIIDEVLLKAIPEPRAHLSKYAPKMMSTVIPVEKIREVIGSGGKVIQKICAECEVKVDVEEDGHVFVSGVDQEKCERAMTIIDTIVNDPEPGTYYTGRVTRLMDFGAFVEIAPRVKKAWCIFPGWMSSAWTKCPMWSMWAIRSKSKCWKSTTKAV